MKRNSMNRIHKVRRINRKWVVGYSFGSEFVFCMDFKTRSEANLEADSYDEAVNHGDMYL